MENHRKESKNSGLKVLAVLLVLLALLLAGACAFLFSRYTWVAGGLREKGAAYMDLRGEELSLADFEELTRAFPDCDILWDVPLQGGRVSSDAASVTVSQLTEADWQALELLPGLTELNAPDCRDYAALVDFGSRHPACRVNYTVALGGQEYPWDAQSVTLSHADAAQLEALLVYLPNLTRVELTGQTPGDGEMEALMAAFPDICFRWPISLGSTTVDSAAEELDLRGENVDFDGLCRLLKWMPNLRRVELTGCPLADEQVIELASAYPDCQFLWELQIDGKTFRTDARELDVSGWQVESTEEIERLLPCFFNLERVVMCGCGLDDETMDDLNRRYEDIRFVWSVQIQDVQVRTDATWFYPYKYHTDMVVDEEDLYPLRYCTDLECIDIGHMGGVITCQWAAYMPNLQYLIIGETKITDLSPLSGLKNLKYLEMFTIPVVDYTPLLGCTGMEDLNLGLTYGDPDVIARMTWLKNLWWCDANGIYNPARREAVTRMCEALKDTRIAIYVDHPVAGGWRKLPNYFAMRDLMDMFYLT